MDDTMIGLVEVQGWAGAVKAYAAMESPGVRLQLLCAGARITLAAWGSPDRAEAARIAGVREATAMGTLLCSGLTRAPGGFSEVLGEKKPGFFFGCD